MNKGCWVAAVTPMLQNGEIDYQSFNKLLAGFVSAKLAGVVILGTTGESVNISYSEREKLLSIASQVLSSTDWLVGVGHASMAEAIKLSEQAARFNPTGLMVVTPYYNRPMVSGLVSYFQAIMNATNMPIIAYNVPTRTGIDAEIAVWDKLYGQPNFLGIKEAHSDVRRAHIYRMRYPNLLLFSGNDYNIQAWNKLGGDGLISVIANAAPTMVSDFCRGIESIHVSHLLTAVEHAVNPIAIKCIMHKLGLIKLGMRLPLMVTTDIYNKVTAELSSYSELLC